MPNLISAQQSTESTASGKCEISFRHNVARHVPGDVCKPRVLVHFGDGDTRVHVGVQHPGDDVSAIWFSKPVRMGTLV